MKYTIKTNWIGRRNVFFNCPSCQGALVSKLKDAGRTFPCALCGKPLVAPGMEALEEEAEFKRANQVANKEKHIEAAPMEHTAELATHEADRAKTDLILPGTRELERLNKMTPMERKAATFTARAARVERLKNMTREQRIEYRRQRAERIAEAKRSIAKSKQVRAIIAEANEKLAAARTLKERVEIGTQLTQRISDARAEPSMTNHVQGGQNEKLSQLANQIHGPLNPPMICPHCQKQGTVRTKLVDRKKGVSGGKATGAILTGGVSLLVTGLSRNEKMTRAHCGNCNNSWDF